MVGESGRNQSDHQQRRTVCDADFQSSIAFTAAAEQTARTASARRANSSATTSSATWSPQTCATDAGCRNANASCPRYYSAKSAGAKPAAAAASRAVDVDLSWRLLAPIVVCRVRQTILACGKQIVTIGIFDSRAAINVIALPGILW